MQNRCATCTRILDYLSDCLYVTGTELGKRLGISRAAVHKHIDTLKASGLPVEGVSGRGYRLVRGVILMDAGAIMDKLDVRSRNLVRRIIVEYSVDSTSSEIARLSTGQPVHGVVCIAEAQPAGRGRRGKHWVATPFRNLMMSLGWVYESWPREMTGLSAAAGISLIKALKEIGIEGVGMKWPNDLVFDGRKLGGILIDITGESGGQCAIVIGVGINAHIDDSDGRDIDQPWTDLGRMCKRDVDRNELAAACLSGLCRLLESFPKTGFQPWREKWTEVDVLTGEEVSLCTPENGARIHGVVTGIDSGGALMVDVQGRGKRAFLSGEVSVRAR